MKLKNKPNQLAVVVPLNSDDDIYIHGGKIIKTVKISEVCLGGAAWITDPALYDRYGNEIRWHDLDLKPLGDSQTATEVIALTEVQE